MYAVATFLFVAAITLAFSRLATGGLIATGVPPTIASFQARSAFSGAGFTTTESENIVNHAVRRRIISTTMFAGSLGTPTLVVTVMVGLIAPGPGDTTVRSLVLVSGFILIVLAILNGPTTRWLERVGERYAQRRLIPSLESSAQELLVVENDYLVVAARVHDVPAESPRGLRGLDHALPGLNVLAVRRGHTLIDQPPTDLDLRDDDELILAGRRSLLEQLGVVDSTG